MPELCALRAVTLAARAARRVLEFDRLIPSPPAFGLVVRTLVSQGLVRDRRVRGPEVAGDALVFILRAFAEFNGDELVTGVGRA